MEKIGNEKDETKLIFEKYQLSKFHQIEHVGGALEWSQRVDFKTAIGCKI